MSASEAAVREYNRQVARDDEPLLVIKRAHLPQYVSGFFLLLLIVQYMAPIDWGAYAELQANSIYKQVTGFIIMGYVLYQWHLAYLRFSQKRAQAFSALKHHRWVGTIAPILVFMHGLGYGYGFQTALLFTFLMVMVIGMFNFQAIGVRAKWYINTWTVMHISFAILSLILMFYHLYVIYWYVA